MSGHQHKRKPVRGQFGHHGNQNRRGQAAQDIDSVSGAPIQTVIAGIGNMGNTSATERPRRTLEMPRGPPPPSFSERLTYQTPSDASQPSTPSPSVSYDFADRNQGPQSVTTYASQSELDDRHPQHELPYRPSVPSTDRYGERDGNFQQGGQPHTPHQGRGGHYVPAGRGHSRRRARGSPNNTSRVSSPSAAQSKVQKARNNRSRGGRKRRTPAEDVYDSDADAEVEGVAEDDVGRELKLADHKIVKASGATTLQDSPAPVATAADPGVASFALAREIVKDVLAHDIAKQQLELQHRESESQRHAQANADAMRQLAAVNSQALQFADNATRRSDEQSDRSLARNTEVTLRIAAGQAETQAQVQAQQHSSELRDVITQSMLMQQSQVPQGYMEVNRIADQAELNRRGSMIWNELNSFWKDERLCVGLNRIGQTMIALCRQFMPVADRVRRFEWLKQSEALASVLQAFDGFLMSRGKQLESYLNRLGSEAGQTISTTSSPDAAKDAMATFARSSDAIRLSTDIPQIVQQFDRDVRQAYIQTWPFVHDQVTASSFINGWSSVRGIVNDMFNGYTSLGVVFTGITISDLDQAKREVTAPSLRLMEQLSARGITNLQDPRFLQAVTLRDCIVPQILSDGTLDFGDLDFSLLFSVSRLTLPNIGGQLQLSVDVPAQQLSIGAPAEQLRIDAPAQQLQLEDSPSGFVEDELIDEGEDDEKMVVDQVVEEGDGDVKMS